MLTLDELDDIVQLDPIGETFLQHSQEQKSNSPTTTMKDISSISHLLHLDLPLPEHCNMTMELNHTDTDASGRPLLGSQALVTRVWLHARGRERCTLQQRQSSFSSKTTLSKNCRSALTHYAWGAGCHSMMTLYHSTCTRYRGKQQQQEAEPSTKIDDSSDTSSSRSDATNTHEASRHCYVHYESNAEFSKIL